MSTSSPFDEPTNEEPTPPSRRRKRRPWWRWNLVTLAISLFALMWLRELFGIGLGLVWMLALTVFVVWGLGPAFFVTTWLTTMAERADAEEGLQLRPWAGNLPLVVLKVVAVLLGLFSLVHLCIAVYAIIGASYNNSGIFRGMGGSQLMQQLMSFAWVAVQPMMEFLAAATLFVLAEIALRLKPQPSVGKRLDATDTA